MNTLKSRNDWDIINKSLENNQITVVDNFFTQATLFTLKNRMLYESKFHDYYGEKKYQAINYLPETDSITDLIVKNLKQKIKILPEFKRGWSFIYANNSNGVRLHSDPSLINLNMWVSDDDISTDPKLNGLIIYEIFPPSGWERKDWNGNPEKVLKYLEDKKIEPVKVNYKNNRAVFFNGMYLHKSDKIAVKKQLNKRRISYTLLFGLNENRNFR